MRKINMILSGFFVLSLGFVGCNSEEAVGSEGTTTTTGTPVDFSATLNTEDSEMKKLAYGTENGGSTPINWTSNDRIRIHSSFVNEGSPVRVEGIYTTDAIGASAKFTHVAGGGTEITWAKNFSHGQEFKAFYPASSITGFTSNGRAQFTVPNRQYPTAENGMGMDNVVLYAATSAMSESNIALTFNNVVTVLQLDIPLSEDEYGDEIVIENIKVTAKGANADRLAGTFTAPTEGANPATSFGTFTATDERNIVIAYPPTGWKSGTLYIALAPYQYDGLEILITGTNGVSRIVSKEGFTIDSRKLYPIKKTQLEWRRSARDMAILVKSIPATGASAGAIVTSVIGSADYSLAWVIDNTGVNPGRVSRKYDLDNSSTDEIRAILEDATPLYFATGNLVISDGSDGMTPGAAYIAYFDAITPGAAQHYGQNTVNNGLFQWGVHDGVSNTLTPTTAIHISGNPDYDIARNMLDGNWRLPTAIEWSFLMETQGSSVTTSWSSGTVSYSDSHSNGRFFNSLTNYLFTVVDINGEILYLPAMGTRSASGSNSGAASQGYYWMGTHCGSTTEARAINFAGNAWTLSRSNRASGIAVRPVTE